MNINPGMCHPVVLVYGYIKSTSLKKLLYYTPVERWRPCLLHILCLFHHLPPVSRLSKIWPFKKIGFQPKAQVIPVSSSIVNSASNAGWYRIFPRQTLWMPLLFHYLRLRVVPSAFYPIAIHKHLDTLESKSKSVSLFFLTDHIQMGIVKQRSCDPIPLGGRFLMSITCFIDGGLKFLRHSKLNKFNTLPSGFGWSRHRGWGLQVFPHVAWLKVGYIHSIFFIKYKNSLLLLNVLLIKK